MGVYDYVSGAKFKVATIFAALGVHSGTEWRELVSGSWHATGSIVGGYISADVGYDGEWAVYVGKQRDQRQITLASGMFENTAYSAMTPKVDGGEEEGKRYVHTERE